MQHFDIPDMTCGHCVLTVTQAVQSVDPAAKVHADLASHGVQVASTADPARLSAAIAAAGYTNTPRI
ncbi:heavy-metal-associated domain-containing protein [Falsiroseomonas oryzae]|uniref:heavy-metal-associated domain-containing protein n=1 Tax=Falsiroseomonas oryzae TaxID=2766473 RepID=UPI0022EB3EC6|nr:heavy-metal-associated domain-containing protein [Roseomonas sp. MO-31]